MFHGRRRLIFFKIRGNQPLKRLLKAYKLSAFLNDPDTPLDFYFNGRTVYCHDTAQALGLQDTDVIKATLPRMRVIIQGIQSLASEGTVQVTRHQAPLSTFAVRTMADPQFQLLSSTHSRQQQRR